MPDRRRFDDRVLTDVDAVSDSDGVESKRALVDLARRAEDGAFPYQAVLAQREDDVVRVVRGRAAEVATEDRAWG